jgi:hypothetical protein
VNIRGRSISLFKRIKEKATSTLRELSSDLSIPKSSIHRHRVNQAQRIAKTGHDFFETEVGVEWLRHLFLAVILIFGVQSGIGSETMSLFFDTILVTSYIGSSPSSIRNIKNKMRETIERYESIQMAEILRRCKDKELHLGGDETGFGDMMFLIMMELTSGFIFTEELVKDRKYKTWWKHVGDLITGCKNILSCTIDGGRALIQVSKNTHGHIMDLFHFLQDMKRLFATKFHSKRRSLQSKLKKLSKQSLLTEEEHSRAIEEIDSKFALLEDGQKRYRNTLFTVSTQSHPFEDTAEIKTSAVLKDALHEQVSILRSIAKECDITDKGKLLDRMERRIEPLSRLNDLWHAWVTQSVLCKTQDPQVISWVKQTLLPYVYWDEQKRKSKRKKKLKLYYQNKTEEAMKNLDANPLTKEYLTDDWINWAKSMARKYQRSTSAIEGRNARLSQHYFSARGIRSSHAKSLTTLHNFWIRQHDNTTAAERLCGYKPPNLFRWILDNMRELPLPRNRHELKKSAIQQLPLQ